MKTLIIYTSVHHGNTEKIGKIIAESLNADMVKAKDFNLENLSSYDLIGFGSGIYMSKFHQSITDLIENMPMISNKKAFVFSTSGMGKIEYNKPLEKKLEEKGLKVIGSFACKGFDTVGPFKLIGGIAKGRPNDEDIEKATEWGLTLGKNY
ncbi:MAG: flavodoxin family protein [Bacillota bacterium]|nr:flavodoxin family protein [Bacillota bacterium]